MRRWKIQKTFKPDEPQTPWYEQTITKLKEAGVDPRTIGSSGDNEWSGLEEPEADNLKLLSTTITLFFRHPADPNVEGVEEDVYLQGFFSQVIVEYSPNSGKAGTHHEPVVAAYLATLVKTGVDPATIKVTHAMRPDGKHVSLTEHIWTIFYVHTSEV